MATNNSVNLSSSGIVSYNGSGTFSALANPLTVANGGSGVSSSTAYAVLCGGTTSTNPIQSIASVGTSGQVLTSNGAGALPTFQTPAGGSDTFTWSWTQTSSANPADSTTYFVSGNYSSLLTASSGITRMYANNTCTLNQIYGRVRVLGTTGTTENVTIFLRKNNTTDTNITTTSQWSSSSVTFSATSLGISLSAGDYIELKYTTPAWTTNPTSVVVQATAYGTY